MKTVIEFYTYLLWFMRSSEFFQHLADNVQKVASKKTSGNISLKVSPESLKKLYDDSRNSDLCEKVWIDLIGHCFQDLSKWINDEGARDLFYEWEHEPGLRNHLFVHVMKTKDLGGNYFGEITIRVSHLDVFKGSYEQPGLFVDPKNIHFSGEENFPVKH